MKEIRFSDDILQEDIVNFSRRCLPFEKLNGSTILVTGATGLIGSTLVKALAYCNSIGLIKTKILCIVRSREKALDIFKEIPDSVDLEFIVQDISNPVSYAGSIDYIIHGASITSSKMFVSSPVETITTAISGTQNLLELAVNKKVKGFVYLSSMEVYGVFDKADGLKTENDYGIINPVEVRSSYSESKRMAECLCKAYQIEKGVPVRIARLVQTFGPGVDIADNRVFAQFARSVINVEDIILHTKGETKRKYLYTIDAVYGIMLLLLKGVDGEAYNIANPDSFVSIYDMACLVASLDKTKKVKVRIEIDDINKFGYAPTLILNLSTEKIEQLGWKASVGLKEAFERMIASMRQRS